MDGSSLKEFFIIVIFCCGFFGVFSAQLCPIDSKYLSIANLFSSGVLLSAGFVHLLSDATSNLYGNDNLPQALANYPWAFVITAFSFLVLFFIEKLVMVHKDAQMSDMPYHGSQSSTPIPNNPKNINNPNNPINTTNTASDGDILTPIAINLDINTNNNVNVRHIRLQQHSHSHSHSQYTLNSQITSNTHSTQQQQQKKQQKTTKQSQKQKKKTHLQHLPHLHALSPCVHSQAGSGHTHTHNELSDIKELCTSNHFVTAIVLLLGLGIHSFFAGLALGATNRFNNIIALGVGIICHKYLAAFTLGVPLRKSTKNRLIVIAFALSFASMTPMGIGLGWIFSKLLNINGPHGYISDFLICAAAGTFIYVAVVEVLVAEFGNFDETYKQMRNRYINDINSISSGSGGDGERRKIMHYGSTNVGGGGGSVDSSNNGNGNSYGMHPKSEIDQLNQLCPKMACVFLGFCLMSLLAAWV